MQYQIPYQPDIQLEIPRDNKLHTDRLKKIDRGLKSDLVSCVCGQCDNLCGRYIPKVDQKLSQDEK